MARPPLSRGSMATCRSERTSAPQCPASAEFVVTAVFMLPIGKSSTTKDTKAHEGNRAVTHLINSELTIDCHSEQSEESLWTREFSIAVGMLPLRRCSGSAGQAGSMSSLVLLSLP